MEAASWSEEEIVPVLQEDSLPRCSDGPSTKAMRLDKLSGGTSVTHHQAMDFQIPHEENTRRKKLGLSKLLLPDTILHKLWKYVYPANL